MLIYALKMGKRSFNYFRKISKRVSTKPGNLSFQQWEIKMISFRQIWTIFKVNWQSCSSSEIVLPINRLEISSFQESLPTYELEGIMYLSFSVLKNTTKCFLPWQPFQLSVFLKSQESLNCSHDKSKQVWMMRNFIILLHISLFKCTNLLVYSTIGLAPKNLHSQ